MSRLGELLVAAGLLDGEKLAAALRAQVVWGGRLGTNLVELGFVELDDLSRVLGQLHGVPAALARHFDKADPALQRRVSPALADKYSFVPLVVLEGDQIAIACLDPPNAAARAEIAAAFGIAPDALVISLAAEQRIRYQLERVYDIARDPRYLRSRGPTVTRFPELNELSIEPDSDVEIEPLRESEDVDIPIDWDEPEPAPALAAAPPPAPPPATARARTDQLAALLDRAIDAAPEPAPEPLRRAYVKTLADDSDPPSLPPAAAPASPPPSKNALGRIAIRRVAIAPAASTGGVPEAAKAIRRAGHRDKVAELVLSAIDRFAPAVSAAALLVVRGDTATTWRHVARSDAALLDVAMPLDEPGLLPRALAEVRTARQRADALVPLDTKLLGSLDGAAGELAIVPIAVAGTVLCVIACTVTSADLDALREVETFAASAGTAFARLMRDASR